MKINILVRTHERPRHFERCIKSVIAQTHSDIRIIVASDSANDYLRFYPKLEIIKVVNRGGMSYNLHLNRMLDMVTDGHIIILDDDDYLSHPTVLEDIAKSIEKGKSYLARTKRERLIPSDRYFGKIKRGEIAMSCIILWHEHKNKARFKNIKAGDYHFIKDFKGTWNYLDKYFITIPSKSDGKTYLF